MSSRSSSMLICLRLTLDNVRISSDVGGRYCFSWELDHRVGIIYSSECKQPLITNKYFIDCKQLDGKHC